MKTTHLLIPKSANLFSASGWATGPYYLRPCCVNLLCKLKTCPIISFVYLQCSVSMASNNVNTFLKSPNKKLLCFVRRWRYKAKQGNSRIITKQAPCHATHPVQKTGRWSAIRSPHVNFQSSSLLRMWIAMVTYKQTMPHQMCYNSKMVFLQGQLQLCTKLTAGGFFTCGYS